MKLLEQSVTKGVVRNSVSKSKKLLEIQSLELKLDKDISMLKLKLELSLILIHKSNRWFRFCWFWCYHYNCC